MKIVLSVFLVIAVIGCVALGIGFAGVQGSLNKTTTQLETAQSDLSDAQAELTDAKIKLTNADTELQTAKTQLTDAERQLENTQTQLTDTSTELDSTIEQKTRMENEYLDLRDQIELKRAPGDKKELYITPNDPDVSAITGSIAGTYSDDIDEVWRDFRRLYDWVENNITYNNDTNLPILPESLDGELKWLDEYWKMPSETLHDKFGDCEDISGLLASMILNYNNHNYGVWAVTIHNDDSGHVAVMMPVEGNQLSVLDVPGHYFTGIDNNWLNSEPVNEAVDNWLDTWAEEMPGAQITTVYSDDFCINFSSNQEFFDWFANR